MIASETQYLLSVNYLDSSTITNYINVDKAIPSGMKWPSMNNAVGSYSAMYPNPMGNNGFTSANGARTTRAASVVFSGETRVAIGRILSK